MTTKVREIDFTQFAFAADSDYGRCLQSYIDQVYRKSNSIYSQTHYAAILQEFFSREPRKQPHLYTREDITAYISSLTVGNGRSGKPPSGGTQNGRLSVLTGFYKHASTYGILGEDGHLYPLFPYLSPCANVRFAKRAVAPNKGISDEELALFFKAIGTGSLRALRDRALFLMYFFCCRRAQELLSLRWRDLSQEIILDGGQSRTAWVYHWRGSRANTFMMQARFHQSRPLPSLPISMHAAFETPLPMMTFCLRPYRIMWGEAATIRSGPYANRRCGVRLSTMPKRRASRKTAIFIRAY